MITGPEKWYDIASALEQAVYADLSTKPTRHSVVPGSIAWDECDCGLLAVSVGQIYLTEVFPEPLSRRVGNACDAPWEAAEIVVQVVRCAPNPDDPMTAPTTAELDTSAREVLTDAYEMMRALSMKLCQMNNDRDIADFVLRPLTAQGPAGGCVGNEVRAIVSLPRN